MVIWLKIVTIMDLLSYVSFPLFLRRLAFFAYEVNFVVRLSNKVTAGLCIIAEHVYQ